MKYLFGNWKMNQTISLIDEFSKNFKKQKLPKDVKFAIAVPFPYVQYLQKKLRKNCEIGVQNVCFAEKGAYTGEISVNMLNDLGVNFCLVGHSERRQIFKETNEQINKKIQLLLSANITPVLCVGETLKELKANKTEEVLKNQLNQCLLNLQGDTNKIVIAYEPVWAIGTGKTATAKDVQKNIKFIKKHLIKIMGNTGKCIKVLYGGSVKPENTFELLNNETVDGALVGGASLSAETFVNIGKQLSGVN